LVASMMAVAVSMACQQTASAWSEFKLSVGANLGWVGGGNRLGWGLYRSAPYPGGPDLPPMFRQAAAAQQAPGGGFGGGYLPGPYVPGPVGPGFQSPPPAPAHDEAFLMPEAPPVPASYNASGLQQTRTPYYNSGYQPVGYFPGSYYQAPTSWYGR